MNLFCPATLKETIKWSFAISKRYLFAFLLILSFTSGQTYAQHWLNVNQKDFGSGSVNSTSSDPASILSPGTTEYTPITSFGSSPNDGFYAISTNSVNANGNGSFSLWINAKDHTTSTGPGAGTGYMMIVNANFVKKGPQNGSIFDLPISVRAVPGARFRIKIYAANIMQYGQPLYNNSNGSGTKPGYVGFGVYTGSKGTGINLGTNQTYTLDFTSDNTNKTLPWQLCQNEFTLPTSTAVSTVYFNTYNSDPNTNSNNSNMGNDFVLDDFSIEQQVINLGGKIYLDQNWNTSGMTAFTSGSGVLYVVLVDSNNTVVSVAPVQANGSYSFTDIPYATSGDIGLKLILTSQNPIPGTTGFTPSAAGFPPYLFPTGVNKSNIATASQLSLNAMLLTNTSADITNADFGITLASFGDAPDTYKTTITAGGAESALLNTLYIGSSVAGETNGQPSVGANSNASDNGVSSIPTLVDNATSYSLSVSVFNNTGSAQTLQGWIDFNRNGTFDTGEYASVSVPSSASQQTVTLTWSGLTGGVAGTSYIRLRLNNYATKTSSDATGVKGAGEVEDYTLCIFPVAPTSGGDIAQCASSPTVQTITATASVVSGSETLVWYDAASNGNIVFSPTLSSVGTVTYYAQSNANTGGCSSATRIPVKLTIYALPTTTIQQTDAKCFGTSTGEIKITASGGLSPYVYSKDNGATYTSPAQSVPYTFTGLSAGNYQIKVKDNNGCISNQ